MYFYEEYRSRNKDSYGNGTVYNNDSRLDLTQVLAYMEALTETYKKYRHSHPALLEAACFRVMYPAMLLDPAENDPLAGRADVLPLGLGHQYTNGEFGFVINKAWFRGAMADRALPEEQRARLRTLWDYWETRNTIAKAEDRQPASEKQYMHAANWSEGPATLLPSYRIAGLNLDYEKLLRLGLPGLMEEVRRSQAASPVRDTRLYEGMVQSLEVVAQVFLWYADRIRAQAGSCCDPARRAELAEMARICRKLAGHRPDTFREALQLVCLYSIVAGPREWGRMDDYLAEYYAQDVRAGLLDDEETIRLLTGLWRLMIAKEQITDDRVIIGGRGRRHERNADRLAMLMMETSRRVADIVPQLTLRFYQGQNPALYEKGLEVIGEGCTYPMLYNDDVIIPGIMKVFGVEEREAEDYLPFGCGEFIINHRRINTPNSFINLSNALLGTLNNGRETLENAYICPDRGCLADYESFDELFDAYCRNVDDLMDIAAAMQGRSYEVLREDMSMNLISVLYDDCLARGRGLLDGGAAGLDGCCEMYGLVTAGESLYAIKKLVYEDRAISRETLTAALKAQFAGYERERAMLLAAPKYGNDDPAVDAVVAKVHELVCFSSLGKSGKYGLDRFTIVNINNKGNTMLGRFTGATPNGRPARDSLSNGNNPTAGMDKNGVTAFLNSLLKMRTDIHAGVVQNMKFSKEVFRDMRDTVVKPLLDAYFQGGGAQAMISVVGREDLENAMREPEKYGNLIVRVGGFSARFVELDRDIQTDILNRTMY